jgi:hypothetical protein
VLVSFNEPSSGGYTLDQSDDLILHLSAVRDGQELTFEIWGNTTLITPEGERHAERRFQQVSTISHTESEAFTWSAVRTAWDDVPWADDDATPPDLEELKRRARGNVIIQVSSGGRSQVFDHQGNLLAGKHYMRDEIEFRAAGTAEDVHDHIWDGAIAQGTS